LVEAVALVVDERAATAGEVVLFDDGDAQAGFGEARGEGYAAGSSAWRVTLATVGYGSFHWSLVPRTDNDGGFGLLVHGGHAHLHDYTETRPTRQVFWGHRAYKAACSDIHA
jgi:hypothetical protein